MNLASDNVTGASEAVLEAIIAANAGPQPAYGADSHTARAEALLSDIFERPVTSFLVATGTAANALALAAMSPPWGAVFCHEESHIIDDECGAPEMFSAGAKLVGIPGEAGKIDPAGLREALARHPRGVVKAVQPAALSVSQVSEAGTLYTLDELATLTRIAREAGLRTHLDGARFANALVALDVPAADMTWRAGIDVLSFGATKNGCLACEAVVFFDDKLAQSFAFRRKRSGQTISKGRLLGAQMSAYLTDAHWLANARHANARAAQLAEGLSYLPGVRLPFMCQANEVFAVLPGPMVHRLRDAGYGMAPWASRSLPRGFVLRPDEQFVRMVTAFDTPEAGIKDLLARAAAAA